MKKYHHNEISNFVQKAGEIMNSFILYIDGKMLGEHTESPASVIPFSETEWAASHR